MEPLTHKLRPPTLGSVNAHSGLAKSLSSSMTESFARQYLSVLLLGNRPYLRRVTGGKV